MNVNYYVDTPDGEEIHLGGQSSPGPFQFRAHPARDVMSYESWLGLLDLGQIRNENHRPVTRDEMVEIADSGDWRSEPRRPGRDQFDDGRHRFTTVWFC